MYKDTGEAGNKMGLAMLNIVRLTGPQPHLGTTHGDISGSGVIITNMVGLNTDHVGWLGGISCQISSCY